MRSLEVRPPAGGALKSSLPQEELYFHVGGSLCVSLLADISFLALLDDLLTGWLEGCLKFRGPGKGNLAGERTVDQSHDIGLGGGVGERTAKKMPPMMSNCEPWTAPPALVCTAMMVLGSTPSELRVASVRTSICALVSARA